MYNTLWHKDLIYLIHTPGMEKKKKKEREINEVKWSYLFCGQFVDNSKCFDGFFGGNCVAM